MRVTRELALSVPVEREGGALVYVHTVPVERDVFEANYKLIARAWSEMIEVSTTYAFGTGPRIAAMVVRDAGKAIAAAAGEDGDAGAGAFLAEVERRTALVAPTAAAWEAIPLAAAVARGQIDAAEHGEMLNQVVFFTLACAITKSSARQKIAEMIASAMGASIALSNSTEFAASLPISTPAGTNGGAAASSVPS